MKHLYDFELRTCTFQIELQRLTFTQFKGVSNYFFGMLIMTNMLMCTRNVVPYNLLRSVCEASKLSQRLLRCCCRRRTYVEAFFTLLRYDGNMTSMRRD